MGCQVTSALEPQPDQNLTELMTATQNNDLLEIQAHLDQLQY